MHPRWSPLVPVVVGAMIAGGCAQVIGTGWTPAGAGGGRDGSNDGGAAATSATSVTSVTSAATSGTASGAVAGSTGASGGCTSPTTCPGMDGVCAFRTCVAGVCGSAVAPVHTPCAEAGGVVCNGAGSCVACVADPDCSGMHAQCTPTGCVSCDDGVQNGNESDVDCGGACQKCSAGKHCVMNPDCAPHLACENGTCTEMGDGHRDGNH